MLTLMICASCSRATESAVRSDIRKNSEVMIAKRDHERDVFLSSCFRQEGFHFQQRNRAIVYIGVFPVVAEADLSDIERRGYGLADALTMENGQADPNLAIFNNLPKAEQASYVRVQKACNLQESKNPSGEVDKFFDRLGSAQSRYQKQAKLKSAMHLWSQCMKRSGISGVTTRDNKFLELIEAAARLPAPNSVGESTTEADRMRAVEALYAKADVTCLRPVLGQIRQAWLEAARS
jgi:hypothetical protein